MNKYLKKKKYKISGQTIVSYVLVAVITAMVTVACQRVKYESQVTAINASHEEEMSSLRDELQNNYETKISELKQYYEYGGDVSEIEREAEYIAKVIYGTARNHADDDQRAVVWCILNRVEHYAYPDTVVEVCEQPKQWIGYSDENPVLTDLYDLALEELKIWHSGDHRPMSNEYIYLSWSSKEILLRDTFEENKSTNYWRMK